MIRTMLAAPLFLALAPSAHAAQPGPSVSVGATTASGVEYGLSPLLQYDVAHFSDDRLADGSHRFDTVEDWRRAGIAVYVRKKGVFDAIADYDVKVEAWMDVYARVTTRAGNFRLGQFKTPVGMDDGATSSGATTFIERALPEAAIHQGRRQGLDWAYAQGTRWLVTTGVFAGGNLDGKSDGRAVAGRVVFTPVNDGATRVLHVGASASREWRDDDTARFAAYPEIAITPVRLIDSGKLHQSGAIDRYGLEFAWRNGAWSAQSEWLGATARRDAGREDFHAEGAYVQGSWLVTGEVKPYRSGGFGNPRPQHPGGALELALRYSTLDLDDGLIAGGRQHDWTVGANWYFGTNLKLALNYIRVDSERGTTTLDPDIVAARMQFAF